MHQEVYEMLVKSKEDITLVLVNLYKILSWNKYYNMTIHIPVQNANPREVTPVEITQMRHAGTYCECVVLPSISWSVLSKFCPQSQQLLSSPQPQYPLSSAQPQSSV